MRNARMILAIGIAVLAVGACNKQQQQQQPKDQNIAIDADVPDSGMAGNAQIETLPADESSTTPSNQLQNGYDNPDVNDLGTSNSE